MRVGPDALGRARGPVHPRRRGKRRSCEPRWQALRGKVDDERHEAVLRQAAAAGGGRGGLARQVPALLPAVERRAIPIPDWLAAGSGIRAPACEDAPVRRSRPPITERRTLMFLPSSSRASLRTIPGRTLLALRRPRLPRRGHRSGPGRAAGASSTATATWARRRSRAPPPGTRSSQEYHLRAGGVNMWGARDEFHFAWKRMKGDFILQARVELLGEGVDPHRKLGFIVRSTLDPDSPYADAAVHGDGLTSLQYRRAKGAITEQVTSPVKGPDFVQLERKGNTYTMSVARFGAPLTSSRLDGPGPGRRGVRGPLPLLAQPRRGGAGRCSGTSASFAPPRKASSPTATTSAACSRSSTSRRAAGRWSTAPRSPSRRPTGRPTGARSSSTPAAGSPRPAGGFIASTSRPARPPSIDTGFANRNNNDHVLSFDGTRARHQRPERPGRPVDRVHPARHGGNAAADHAPDARPTSTASRRTAGTSSTPAAATASSTSTGWPPTAAARRFGSPTGRGSTTARSTRPTASTSTSTRRAAGPCRSGA